MISVCSIYICTRHFDECMFVYTGCFPFSGIVSLLHNDISSFLLNLDVVVCKTLQRLIHLLLLYNIIPHVR